MRHFSRLAPLLEALSQPRKHLPHILTFRALKEYGGLPPNDGKKHKHRKGISSALVPAGPHAEKLAVYARSHTEPNSVQ